MQKDGDNRTENRKAKAFKVKVEKPVSKSKPKTAVDGKMIKTSCKGIGYASRSK